MDTSVIPVLTQNSGDTVAYTFAGWVSTDLANDTAIWTHGNWTDSDIVNLTVSGYYDPAGNEGEPYTWEFHIEDGTPPQVLSTSPYDGERNVAVAIQHITVVCSEPMDTSLTPEIYYVEANGNRPNIDFYQWSNSTTAVFNLSGTFSQEDHIELRTGAGFQDLSGNGMSAYYWWFHTYDPNPPYVLVEYPEDGGSADRNETVYVTFSEVLDESVIPAISQASDDPGGWAFLGWEREYVDISGDTVEVSKAVWVHDNWTSETVNLTVSGYMDYGNNVGDAYSWEFSIDLYEAHGMMRINSDTELDNMAASEGWAGDGSPGNPYIIEGYSINGDDGRGGYCIYVGNTTHHLIIRQNSLNYAWTDNPVEPYYPRASVVLYNAENVHVDDNNMMHIGASYGVYAIASYGINITGNRMGEFWESAIYTESCDALFILGNDAYGEGDGIYLMDSPYADIEMNTLEAPGDYNGITLENSSYSMLYGNAVKNYTSGIVFDAGAGTIENISLEENRMLNCGLMIWGWQYEHWASHILINNTVNNRPLIYLNDMDDFEMNYTIQAGQIYIVDSYNISISEQFLVRGTVGVYVAMSQLVQIQNSTIAYNMYGVYMVASTDNTIWHNNFVGNDEQARDDGDSGDNQWYMGYPYGGNYWDDYDGPDDYMGPDQNIAGSDGFIDSPYDIDGTNSDRYPLIDPTAVGIEYEPGWQMVALPWLENKTDISDALNGASWDRAAVYLNGTWYTYDNTVDDKFNVGFPQVDRTMGIWVNFTAEGIIGGDSPIHTGNITAYLYHGWNLVDGVFAFQVQEIFGSVSPMVETTLPWNSTMVNLDANDTMFGGKGYWVYLDDNYTITIDTDNFTVSIEQGIVPAASPEEPCSSSMDLGSPGNDVPASSYQYDISTPLSLAMLLMLIVAALYTSRRR